MPIHQLAQDLTIATTIYDFFIQPQNFVASSSCITKSFLAFSGGIEMKPWTEMGQIAYQSPV